jgi:hypothetical protein
MNEISDPKDVGKKIFLSYHEDGLIDIGLGIILLIFSIFASFTEYFWLAGISVAIYLPIYTGAKKTITQPRIGYVKMGYHSKSQQNIIILMFISVNIGAVLFALLLWRDFTALEPVIVFLVNYFSLILGIIGGALCGLIAYILKLNRFYIYSVIIFVVLLSGQIIAIPLGYSLLIMGISILAIGVLTLIKFVKKYPRLQGESPNA